MVVSVLLACMYGWLVGLSGESSSAILEEELPKWGGWRLNLHVWCSEICLELGKQLTPRFQMFDQNIRSLHLQCSCSHLKCTGCCVKRRGITMLMSFDSKETRWCRCPDHRILCHHTHPTTTSRDAFNIWSFIPVSWHDGLSQLQSESSPHRSSLSML